MYRVKTSLLSVLSVLIVSQVQAVTQTRSQVKAKNGWELALFLGTSYSKDETLTIKQDGFPDITLDNAHLSTKPFEAPPYYSIRLSRWSDGYAWEIEHIHQKIYIDDLPPDVQHFEITDGYNLFFINGAWQLQQWDVIARLGAGLVIAHPQITVRGRTNYKPGGGAIPIIWDTDSSYQWTGPAAQ